MSKPETDSICWDCYNRNHYPDCESANLEIDKSEGSPIIIHCENYKNEKVVNMNDGIIEPKENAPFGFTSNLFDGWLWKIGSSIYISMITSLNPNIGNFRKLIENILSSGFIVKVPNPLPKMKSILIKNNYERSLEYDESHDNMIEVWIKRPYRNNTRSFEEH